ncbi:MAG: hypothetical protein HC898_07175 [Phycisphaerales bacterium]|nr:hypothetical protein [Phycisphaerales bacterium]
MAEQSSPQAHASAVVPVQGQPSPHSPSHTTHEAHAPMGAMLEPVLHQACDGHLSGINWFRTTWQRGGAATGYATFRDEAGIDQPVVVKLPVPPNELFWLEHLQQAGDVAPKL